MARQITNLKIARMSPQLLVADIERAIAFYTEKLGFEVDFRYEDFYAGIMKDGNSIHLKVSDYSEENTGKSKSDENLEIQFSVADIETWYQALVDNGVNITQHLRTMPYGKEFYITDIDGNNLGFVSEPV